MELIPEADTNQHKLYNMQTWLLPSEKVWSLTRLENSWGIAPDNKFDC